MKKILTIMFVLFFVSVSFGQDTELVLIKSFPNYDDESSGDYLRIPSEIIYYNNLYIIADGFGANVKVFSEDGKFVRQIGKKGKGPGELSNVFHITLDKESGTLYCNDRSNKRISVFSLEGDYLSSFRVPRSFASLEYFDGKIYVFSFNAEDKTLFDMYDTAGNYIKSFGESFNGGVNDLSVEAMLNSADVFVDNKKLYAVYNILPIVDIFNKNGELESKIKLNVKEFQEKYAKNINNARKGWIDGRISVLSFHEGVVVENGKLYYNVRTKVDELKIFVVNLSGDLERVIPFREKMELPITILLKDKHGDNFIFGDFFNLTVEVFKETVKRE